MKKRVLLLIVLLIVLPFILSAQNPFMNRSPEKSASAGLFANVLQKLGEISNTMQHKIAAAADRMSGGEWQYGIIAFLLAVVFGMVHVIGPGHGKIFTVAYFTSRNAKIKEGFLLSGLINLIDSFSAITMVTLAYFILKLSIGNFTSGATRIMQIVSYSAIAVLAAAHLLSHFRYSRHAHGEETRQPAQARLKPWKLALAVGLVPCPVSSILFTFGIANHIIPFSLVLILGVSLGGMISMSLLSVSIIAGKKSLVRLLEHNQDGKTLFVLEAVFSGLIILFALLLLIGKIF